MVVHFLNEKAATYEIKDMNDMQQRYKTSHFSFSIPVIEYDETIIFNSLTGGTMTLSNHEEKLFNKLSGLNSFKLEEFLPSEQNILTTWIDKDYIVEKETDELDFCKKTINSYLANREKLKSETLSFTILPTDACSMACAYCFENKKKSKVLDKKKIDQLEVFIENILNKDKEKILKKLHIVWYGGEPLLGKDSIEELSQKFNTICEKYNLKYSPTIITNGILLTPDMWSFLQKYNIDEVQITIDGIKEIHDKRRPLKSQGRNFEQILDNISKMPQGIQLCIRVNTDKIVAQSFPDFLKELDKHQIWPHRYKDITIDVRPLRTYAYNKEKEVSDRIPFDRFDSVLHNLRKQKLEYFNNWAEKNNVKKGKLEFRLPKSKLNDFCRTNYSSYSMVIDPEGYIYNCWEYMGDKEKQLFNIKEEYDKNKILEKRDITSVLKDKCYECKFLPVCSNISCPRAMFDMGQCWFDEEQFKLYIKNQYLFYKENPDLMVIKNEAS